MEILFLKHQETTPDYLEKIVEIKNQHWKYSKEQHLDWMHKNLTGEDCHIIVEDENKEVIAYLNLVNLNMVGDNQYSEPTFGIGNVCVDKFREKKGLGLLLMQITNYYLKQNKLQGVLLCKEELVPFYTKSGWIRFEGEFLVAGNKIQGVLMSFLPLQDKRVLIDKNF